jgi:hypothetical protein
MKIAASTRLEEPVFQRADRLAKEDNRTIANLIELCVIKHLPVLEREILGDSFKGAAVSANAKKERAA